MGSGLSKKFDKKHVKLTEYVRTFYDASPLIDLDPKERWPIIKELQNNPTLKQLIKNALNKEIPTYKYISDATEMSVWYSEKYKRVFYLFGEHHDNTGRCKAEGLTPFVPFPAFLTQIFNTTPVFIDLFVEVSPIDELDLDMIVQDKHYYSQKALYRLKAMVKACHRKSGHCPWKTARLHWSDPRARGGRFTKLFMGQNVPDKLQQYYDAYRFYVEYFHYPRKSPERAKKKLAEGVEKLTPEMKEYVLTITQKFNENRRQLLDDLINLFIKIPRVERQFRKSKLQINKIVEIITTVSLERSYQKDRKLSDDTIPLEVRQAVILTHITSEMMNLYTIGRMFKKFDVDSGDNHPKYARFIIFYGGNAHTHTCEKVLEEMGFKKIGDGKNMAKSCIDVSEVPQPFFVNL